MTKFEMPYVSRKLRANQVAANPGVRPTRKEPSTMDSGYLLLDRGDGYMVPIRMPDSGDPMTLKYYREHKHEVDEFIRSCKR